MRPAPLERLRQGRALARPYKGTQSGTKVQVFNFDDVGVPACHVLGKYTIHIYG